MMYKIHKIGLEENDVPEKKAHFNINRGDYWH